MDTRIGIVLIAGAFYVVGQYVASQPQRVQQEVEAGREITIEGVGKATAVPNVAKYMLGVSTGPQATADVALARLSERFEGVTAALEDEGVEKDDIRTTNLSIQPQYDFLNGRQTLRGFEASETVEVTIRDLQKIGAILAQASSEGITEAGGLTFEVDDREAVKLEAQTAAIADAKKKAGALTKELGVRLGRVNMFVVGDDFAPPFFAGEALPLRAGGDATEPPVPVGEQEISVRVSITYELQ